MGEMVSNESSYTNGTASTSAYSKTYAVCIKAMSMSHKQVYLVIAKMPVLLPGLGTSGFYVNQASGQELNG